MKGLTLPSFVMRVVFNSTVKKGPQEKNEVICCMKCSKLAKVRLLQFTVETDNIKVIGGFEKGSFSGVCGLKPGQGVNMKPTIIYTFKNLSCKE